MGVGFRGMSRTNLVRHVIAKHQDAFALAVRVAHRLIDDVDKHLAGRAVRFCDLDPCFACDERFAGSVHPIQHVDVALASRFGHSVADCQPGRISAERQVVDRVR